MSGKSISLVTTGLRWPAVNTADACIAGDVEQARLMADEIADTAVAA